MRSRNPVASGARFGVWVVPVGSSVDLAETRGRESLPQSLCAWVKYSRRRNLLAQQKLPRAFAEINLSDNEHCFQALFGSYERRSQCVVNAGFRIRSQRFLPLALVFSSFYPTRKINDKDSTKIKDKDGSIRPIELTNQRVRDTGR